MGTQDTDPRGGLRTVKSTRPWGDIHMVVRNQECSVDLTHIRPGERASPCGQRTEPNSKIPATHFMVN